MRHKRSLFIFCASLVVGSGLFVVLAPFVVATTLRLWVARAASRDGLKIEYARIEAPFLRPVVVHQLKIASGPDSPFHVLASAARVELDLNVPAIFLEGRGRVLRSLNAETVGVDVRRNQPTPPAPRRFSWRLADDFLATNFNLSGVQLHVENGPTVVDLHDATLSGAQIETGRFLARELTISSPWFQKTFANLRGATSWEESRLMIGALSLIRGLDLDSITIDLSQLSESRLGAEVSLDAFGGKLRARLSSDDHADIRTWDVAGTASEISLAQMSDALSWENRASGSVRACKFTFRGEMANLRDATASVWAETAGLTWRDRTADTIMLGAALHNREVQIEQLYIKQRNNQMTLSGEFALPQTPADWLRPDFRGDVSAAINDLGDFARLFGADPANFAGKIAVEGSVSARERKLAGQLTLSGDSLIVSRAPVESLRIDLHLKESRLEIAEFALRREDDSFVGEGSLDLSGDGAYSGAIKCSVADMADYAGLIPDAFEAFRLGGQVGLEWAGRGTRATHSGVFHAKGTTLRSLESKLLPFAAEFEGEYSPENIFFRQFRLSNQHAALSAFVTVANDYLQLQTVRFDLDGTPKLQGDIFAPFSLARFRSTKNWVAAVSDNPQFDIHLVLEPIDLRHLAGALTHAPAMSGHAAANLELYGPPAALNGTCDLRLRDFVWEDAVRLSGALAARLAGGILGLKANATASGSAPIGLEGTLPLRLEKTESEYALQKNGPMSMSLNFPAIFLSTMPRYLSRGIFHDGILSGQLAMSESLDHPRILGDVHLVRGKFGVGTTLSTRMTFGGQIGVVEFAQLTQNGAVLSARGEIDFHDAPEVVLKLFPTTPLLAAFNPGDCVTALEFSPNSSGDLPSLPVDQIELRTSFLSPASISLHQSDDSGTPLGSVRTFPFCRDDRLHGKTMTLRVAPNAFP